MFTTTSKSATRWSAREANLQNHVCSLHRFTILLLRPILSRVFVFMTLCLVALTGINRADAQCVQFASSGASLSLNLSHLSGGKTTDSHFSYFAKGSGDLANLTIGRASAAGTDIDVYIDIDITPPPADPAPSDTPPDNNTSSDDDSAPDNSTSNNSAPDGNSNPAVRSAQTWFELKLMPTYSPEAMSANPSMFYAVIKLSSTSNLLQNGLSFPLPAIWDYKTLFYGLIQGPLPAAFDVMNPPSVTSISTDCPGPVTHENCASNAHIDLTKIHLTPSPPLIWAIWMDDKDREHANPGNRSPSTGIEITVDADAVTYSEQHSRASSADNKIIQSLEDYTGYSVYQDSTGNSPHENLAFLKVKPLLDSLNVDDPYMQEVGYFHGRFTGNNVADSPEIVVPRHDSRGRSLLTMSYTKTFTTYYGCHTDEDLSYSKVESKHFLHTLAKITWGVNYFIMRRSSDGKYIPDNTHKGLGVFISDVREWKDEEIKGMSTLANGNTYVTSSDSDKAKDK